jgi:hypothetical protein
MEWSTHSTHWLKELFKHKDFKAWSNAVEAKETEKLSPELDDLVARLSRVLAQELECPEEDRAKINKIMELAALAGKTL